MAERLYTLTQIARLGTVGRRESWLRAATKCRLKDHGREPLLPYGQKLPVKRGGLYALDDVVKWIADNQDFREREVYARPENRSPAAKP